MSLDTCYATRVTSRAPLATRSLYVVLSLSLCLSVGFDVFSPLLSFLSLSLPLACPERSLSRRPSVPSLRSWGRSAGRPNAEERKRRTCSAARVWLRGETQPRRISRFPHLKETATPLRGLHFHEVAEARSIPREAACTIICVGCPQGAYRGCGDDDGNRSLVVAGDVSIWGVPSLAVGFEGAFAWASFQIGRCATPRLSQLRFRIDGRVHSTRESAVTISLSPFPLKSRGQTICVDRDLRRLVRRAGNIDPAALRNQHGKSLIMVAAKVFKYAK